MSAFHMPPEYDVDYPAPRGTVLLLTCMDLRLLDDIEEFMAHDNLSNRYDHLVFAGAALGALGAPGGKPKEYPHWRQCFFDHLAAAVDLHAVGDVYIMEHRNCGAYYSVFGVCPDYGDSPEEQLAEEACHLKYATQLEKEIQAWAGGRGTKLKVSKFLMDLRGAVKRLPAGGGKRRPRTNPKG